MTLERRLANLFRLSDENWMRHANPISVWSRYSVLPLLLLCIWSRLWLGWWSLLPGLLAMFWLFFNPILFKRPKSTRNWASRAVLGERVFLNRDQVPIPERHLTYLHSGLNALSAAGLLLAVWAVIEYWAFGAVLGVGLAYLGKSWYLDRMVWLYEDMKGANETYQSWDY